jgi:trans-aconitate 2-methyltransferase
MDSNSLLLINFPNPNHILFDRKNNPENLQEIDHPVFLNKLSETLEVAELKIEYFETYSIWVQDDFHFLIVKKKTAFEKHILSQDRNFYEKLWVRLAKEIRKIVYPYPVKKN